MNKEEIIQKIKDMITEFWDDNCVEVRSLEFPMEEIYKAIREL